MTVKGVNQHRPRACVSTWADRVVPQTGKPAECAGFGHMGMDDARLLAPDDPQQPPERDGIGPWMNRPAQALETDQPRRSSPDQPAQIPFSEVRLPDHQTRGKTPGIQS